MLGILLGLICLAFLTYKGMSILWVAPVSALVVAAFGGMNLLDAFTGDFMKAFWRIRYKLVSYVYAWRNIRKSYGGYGSCGKYSAFSR